MSDTTIYAALRETVRQHTGSNIPSYPSEAPEDYLKRLAKAVSEVTKRLFDAMPESAQLWFDNAATAMAEKLPVPLPEGFDPNNPNPPPENKPAPKRIPRPTGSALPRVPIPRPQVPRPQATVVDPVTVSVGRNQIVTPASKLTPLKQSAPAANEQPVDESVQTTIARMLVANESLSLDQLIKQLSAKGVPANKGTVRHNRVTTLTILRLMREAGWQPPP